MGIDVAGRLHFRVLGPLEVWRDGEPIHLGGSRQRALLALLLIRAKELVTTDQLVEQLFGEERSDTAVNAVRVAVSRLRRLLDRDGDAAVLQTRPGGYVLAVDAEQLDAAMFERLLSEGSELLAAGDAASAAVSLREALGLWRGAPLADLAMVEHFQAEGRRLEQLRQLAVMERIDADLALGTCDELIVELEGLIASDPLAERLRGQLMLAFYRAGRQPDALAVYRDLSDRLRDELGLEPSRALQGLERLILQQDRSLDPSPREAPAPVVNLPSAAAALIGRVRELAEATALLRQMDTRLLTLTGAGGSGKTRLALRIAETRARDYSDGVWFVGFADITDPGLIASTICQALGLADKPGVTPTGRLREWLRDRSVLLLLDNLEQLVPGAKVLGELLANCPRLGLLVTSRVSLSLAGEQQYEVPVLEPSDAIDLFVTRARAVGPHVSIDSDVVLQICERVDRLPLAIELAAARTKALSPVEILERLARQLPVLGTGPRDAPRRQRTLQATIDWSYDLLNEHEQRAFARLSVFASSFTLPAAEAVCDADLDTLQALTDRSLICVEHERSSMLHALPTGAVERLGQAGERRELRRQHANGFTEMMHAREPETFTPGPSSRFMLAVAHQAGGTRYRTLDTLREYGRRRLRQAGEEGDTESSLLDWALDFVEARAGELESLGRSQVLPGVETERRNLVAAVGTDGSVDTRLRLAAGLAELLSLGTGLREIRRVLEGVLSEAGEANTSDVRRARLILGRLLRRLGQLDDARANLTATAQLAAAADDAMMAAMIAIEQAFVEVKSRRHAEAQRFLDQADRHGARHDEQVWSYRLLVEADMRHVAGQRHEARGLYETCIERFRRHGPSMHLIAVLAALADLAVDMDDHETARRCALEVLPMADPVVDAYLRAGALLALGRVSLSAGRPAEAATWLAEAASLDLQRASMEAADTLERLAQALAVWGRHRDATLLLGAASAMRKRFGIEPVAPEQADIDSALTAIRAHLSDVAVTCSLEEGSRLGERDLLALVHGVAPAVAQLTES